MANRRNLLGRSSISSKCISSYILKRTHFKFCLEGFQQCKNKNLIQIFHIIPTSEDITGFSQLSKNFTVTLIIFGTMHNIKTLNKISVSALLKTLWTKFEVIPPQDVGGDTFLEKAED